MGKVIGLVLIIAAGALAAKIITGRGPILPHIVGTTVLAVIGVILLIVWKGANNSVNGVHSRHAFPRRTVYSARRGNRGNVCAQSSQL